MNATSTKADGSFGDTDWERLHAMSEEEAEAHAQADPDNPPMDEARLRGMKKVPQGKVMRRALKLTQEEFARRYAIPLDLLRGWEAGRAMPDGAASAYLRVIAREPDVTARAILASSEAA